MNAEEVVLGAYAAFAKGDMKALAEANHPNAKYRVNGSHRLSGSYNGFEDFRDNFLTLIDKALPNFNLRIDKVVSMPLKKIRNISLPSVEEVLNKVGEVIKSDN